MRTFVYLVRHGESPKTEGTERSRGLTAKGWADATRVTALLKDEGIEVFVSSPYRRAILTIRQLALSTGHEITAIEDLKEQVFSKLETRLPDQELIPLLQASFADPHWTPVCGESISACQSRAIRVLQQLLRTYTGKKIAIGTHGAVMTYMLSYYSPRYDLDFLLQASKPDVYRMEFHDQTLVEIKRLWNGD